MNVLPQCSCTCADGTRCGRRVADGSNPPICHIHKGVAVGVQFKRKVKTPEQILEDLMHSKDEGVRFRAVDAYLKRQERETACPRCATDASLARERTEAIHRLTYEQRCQLHELRDMMLAIIELAKDQPVTWDSKTQTYCDTPPLESNYTPSPATPLPKVEEPNDEEVEEEETEDIDPLTQPPDES